ncbi:RidA family protein [Actinomadura viridis]|uniref:Enamine deaminase RidA (YjgF/YER057c/UK114 family) n=1 Tax=Actinomadura viridis TaxID=58110 RepID=A0A931DEN2_9ACTN|nr:RidA family protein [Actinomadura viridis]MBG6089699.1 enamine deaminase RidA (YjgF/YER057c/UK114 family) [Actinomadura viridis]
MSDDVTRPGTAIRQVSPPALAPGPGYSHVICVDAPGRLVVISGQVPLDAGGALVGPGDLAAQTRQVFTNLRAALEAAGAGWEHLVKLGYFVRDARQVATVRAVRDEFLPAGIAPASTLVEVSALFRDDLLIEIEALAAVPASTPA